MQRILRQLALPIVLAAIAGPALAHFNTKPVTPTVTDSFTVNGIKFTTRKTGTSVTLEVDGRNSTLKGDNYLNAISIGNIGTVSKVSLVSSPWSSGVVLNNSSIGSAGCGASTGKGTITTQMCLDGFGNLSLDKVQQFKFDISGNVKLSAADIKMTLVDNFWNLSGEVYQASFGTKTGGYVQIVTPTPTPTTPTTPTPATPTPTPAPTIPTPAPTTPTPEPSPEPAPAPAPNPIPEPVTPPPVTTPIEEPAKDPFPLPEPALPTPDTTSPTLPSTPEPELIPVPDVGPVKPVDTLPVSGPGAQDGKPSEVPEPESLALMGAGLALVAMLRRRQARNARK